MAAYLGSQNEFYNMQWLVVNELVERVLKRADERYTVQFGTWWL